MEETLKFELSNFLTFIPLLIPFLAIKIPLKFIVFINISLVKYQNYLNDIKII